MQMPPISFVATKEIGAKMLFLYSFVLFCLFWSLFSLLFSFVFVVGIHFFFIANTS